MAPFLSRSGYGSEAIDYVLGLEKVRPNSITIGHHGDSASETYFFGLPPKVRETLILQANRPPYYPISICHSEPGAWHPSFWPTARCPPDGSIFNIGRTMFETDRIPEGWESRCNQMDQIWVPTEFEREVFAKYGVDPSKLVVIPESVDVDFYNPDLYEAMDLPGQADTKFKFLSIFKWEERKGWSILIKAFIREFSLDEGVVLYIKTHEYHGDGISPEDQMNALIQQEIMSGLDKSKLPKIYIMDQDVPTSAMPRLYKAVDAFVISSRGEGWGRPHVEAMAMGLPIIATNWSGPTEYMTPLNSYPLKIEPDLVPITQGAFVNHFWAEPSLTHLRELLRHIVSNPQEAKEKGTQARSDMIHKYSPSIVANIINNQLLLIEEQLAQSNEK
uniref:Glycosyl transferase family 1 domain-containing protein n=1 Tax=Arcella intermedia TaxID=1963864 RepID=A0A6B2L6I8_9EUKA